jgi:hypothetical protein
MDSHTVLVILHVILFAYWLGADWGVFVTARYVADPALTLDERRRFLRAAMQIDLMPRIAFPLLLPVGMQLAATYGAWPAGGPLMAVAWVFAIAWLAVNVLGYRRVGTPAGDRLRRIDQSVRFVLAPVLIVVGLAALIVGRPELPLFVALKLMVFGAMIVVGLILRSIMGQWAAGFRKLATEGRSADVDAMFLQSLGRARLIAFGMWSLSGAMAVLGVARFG